MGIHNSEYKGVIVMLAALVLSMSIATPMQEAPAPSIPDMGIVREEYVIEEEPVEDVPGTEEEMVSDELVAVCQVYYVPDYSGKKSFMSCELFSKSSKQYALQTLATIDDDGFCRVGGRYCIAMGSYFNVSIGQFVDLILDNGVIIPCVIGDMKANNDTDPTHMFSKNGCCSEFLVNMTKLTHNVKVSGDISDYCPEWQPQVRTVVVYELNALEEVP